MNIMNYKVFTNNLEDLDLSKRQVINTINPHSYVTANKLDLILEKYISIETSRYCRKRYLDNFSLEQFDKDFKVNRHKKTPSFTLFQIKSYWGILMGLYNK